MAREAGDGFEDGHRQNRPDGVDEDGLALEDGLERPTDRQSFEERLDHGGAGDRDQGPEEQGDRQFEPPDQHARGAGSDPGETSAYGDEAPYFVERVFEFGEPEAQGALKEDDGHRELDQKGQPVAQGVGMHEPEDVGAEDHAETEEQDERRQPETVGHQLGENPEPDGP